MGRVIENLQGGIKQPLDRNSRKLSLSLGTNRQEGQWLLGPGEKTVGERRLSGAAMPNCSPAERELGK